MRAVATVCLLGGCLLGGAGLAASDPGKEWPSQAFEATGRYQPSAPVDRREARFAARILARAGVVDLAFGDGTGVSSGSTHAELAAAMLRLNRAIPVDEIWLQAPDPVPSDDKDHVVQRVRARVMPLGGEDPPGLQAELTRSDLWAGDRLVARVSVSDRPAYVAAFAWQADDTVVALAPTGAVAVQVLAGDPVLLPGAGAPEISAVAMPGSDQSLEAILIVARTTPFAPDSLAVAVTGQEPSDRSSATSMANFLGALAAGDLSRTALAVLPYRVRSPASETTYTVVLTGFDPETEDAIVEVMSEAFAGYRRHLRHPGGPSGLRLDYVSAAEADAMDRWLTMLLRDLGLSPRARVVVSPDRQTFYLDRTGAAGTRD